VPNLNIYFTDAELAVLAPRMVGGEGAKGDRSAAVQRILGRYAEIVRRSVPDLSVPEWKLVVYSLNGVIHDPPSMISALWHGIEDSISLDKLDTKWDVDGAALVKKLKRLSFAENVAVVDIAERYWLAVRLGQEAKVPGEE
jgi:hypothetical protein